MKKYILAIALIAISATCLVTSTFAAASASLAPQVINVQAGQTFDVMVAISSQETGEYTVRVELNYPADNLKVESFNFVNNWTALTQPGHDLIDNDNGVLIKTAEYPAGVSSTAVFGIVSFSAKKAGTGTIKMGSGSFVQDGSGQNILSGAPEVAFTVTAAAAPAEGQVMISPGSEEETTPLKEKQETTEQQNSFLAIVANLLASAANNVWLGIILIIAVISLTIYSILKRKKSI